MKPKRNKSEPLKIHAPLRRGGDAALVERGASFHTILLIKLHQRRFLPPRVCFPRSCDLKRVLEPHACT